MLLSVVVCCENRLTFGSRSSCKIAWKYESCLIWKVEVVLKPNLVYWYNMGPFVCWCCQRSYTKVKGHQRLIFKIGSKAKFASLKKKLEVWLKPNLVYWYNVGTFTCSWGQRSQKKVKGHVRSICKVAPKCQIWLIWILDQLKPCDPNRCGIKVKCHFASSTNCNSLSTETSDFS